MFGEPNNESMEALGERVATLYKELSYPSAAKFKAALTKRGLDVPDAFVRQLVSEQGSRQLFAAPPRFTGKVVAQHMDERWAGDVLDLQSKTRKKDAPNYVLLVQDIFSRFLLPQLFGARQRWSRRSCVCCETRSENQTNSTLTWAVSS